MGCTSSAPSMDGYISDSYSASVKNENASNDAEQNKEPSSKDVKLVLPSCDNLEKNLELASQNSIKNTSELAPSSEEQHIETVPTSSSTNKLDENQEKMTHYEKDEHNINNDYENTNEEHYTTLREVVDKVMQDSTILQNQPSDDGYVDDDYDYDDKDEAKSFDDSDPPSVVEVEEVVKVQEVPENTNDESKSPSQSECGRATRWEALADIAAELPPTLAVDPITGQIYSLAK